MEHLSSRAGLRRPPRPSRTMLVSLGRQTVASRGRRIVTTLILLALISVGIGFALRPRVVVDPRRMPTVEPFVLADLDGKIHRLNDWRNYRGVVVFVLGANPGIDRAMIPAMQTLVEAASNRSTLFLTAYPDPATDRPMMADIATRLGPEVIALLDPSQELVEGLMLTRTPSAAVLDAQGHILYTGPIAVENSGRYLPSPLLESAWRSLTDAKPTMLRTASVSGQAIPAAVPILPDRAITYNRDVAPILWSRCASCHRPGEVGPFSLLTYAEAKKRAGFLNEVAQSRQMPPWRAVHGYGDFDQYDRLTKRELVILERWVDQGAPEGDPADRKTPPTFTDGWQMGKPDMVLTMPEAFDVPADGDYYRAFVIPMGLDQDKAVAAVEFRPGNRKVVHHSRFYLDAEQDMRLRDEKDAGVGFNTVGGGDIFKPGLGAWVPGTIPQMPPSDVGKIVKKGSDLVMLVHYHGSGKPETDRSSLGIYFSKNPPERSITTISLTTLKIDIPAGEPRHRIALTATLRADCHAISVMPHGHFLMKEISLTATLPSGKVVPMLWVDNWDFAWQGQYHFARPVALPKGTKLDVVAYYDNSVSNPFNPNSPPKPVKFGLGSADEMLGCHVQVIADDLESQKIFDKTLPFGL